MNRRKFLQTTALLATGTSAGCSGSNTTDTTTTTQRTTLQTTTEPTTTPTTTTTTTTSTTTETRTTEQTPTTTSEKRQTTWEVTVVRVVDGDTFEVRFPDGHTEDVRLLGIDTPEIHGENEPEEFDGIPATDEGEDWLREWGHKASEFARSQISGEIVQISVDEQADRRGSYGRLLVYVYHDGGLFNNKLVRQGYARVYGGNFSKWYTLASSENAAQKDNVGLWKFGTLHSTTTTSSSSSSDDGEGSLSIATIHADASGNDHDNENDEYIVFKNTGDSALDLSGWSVRDEAGHVYYFPNGFTLDAGAKATLYTGSGTDTASELYWGSNSAIWNNGGDTIIVETDNGTTVIRKEY